MIVKEHLPRLDYQQFLPQLRFLDYGERDRTSHFLELTEIARLQYYLDHKDTYLESYGEFSTEKGRGKLPMLPTSLAQNVTLGKPTTMREIFQEVQREVAQNYEDYELISELYRSAWNKLRKQGLSLAIMEVMGSIDPRPRAILIPTGFGMGASNWSIFDPPEYRRFGLDSLFGNRILYIRRDINRPNSDIKENGLAKDRRANILLHELVAHAGTQIYRQGTSIDEPASAYYHPYKEMLMEYITREIRRRLGYPVYPIVITDTSEYTVLGAFYKGDFNGPNPKLKHPRNIEGVINEILRVLDQWKPVGGN